MTIAHAVEAPAVAPRHLIQELREPLPQTEHVDPLEVRLGDLEPAVVDVDDVEVALGIVIPSHREQLGLVVADQRREEEGVLVDLLQRQGAVLLVVALAVLEIGDRALDGVAQDGDGHELRLQELRRHEWEVAGVDADPRPSVRW
jgi:hypothetical protein